MCKLSDARAMLQPRDFHKRKTQDKEGGMSGMGSHSNRESRHMFFIKRACAARTAAGAVFAILMVSSYPAFSQEPPAAVQTAGNENAQDDHSYLPPFMRSQTESANSAVAVTTETQVQASAKT